jgi:hypothetical protein
LILISALASLARLAVHQIADADRDNEHSVTDGYLNGHAVCCRDDPSTSDTGAGPSGDLNATPDQSAANEHQTNPSLGPPYQKSRPT